VATILHNLGGLEQGRRQHARGEPYARAAYEIRKQALGEDHRETAADGAALARILDAVGKREEAEQLYRRALAVFERLYGPEHYEIAINLNNLAVLEAAKGETAESERLYRRSLALKEKLLGPDHPDVGMTANNRADALPGPRRGGPGAVETGARRLSNRPRPGPPQDPALPGNLRRCRRAAVASDLLRAAHCGVAQLFCEHGAERGELRTPPRDRARTPCPVKKSAGNEEAPNAYRGQRSDRLGRLGGEHDEGPLLHFSQMKRRRMKLLALSY